MIIAFSGIDGTGKSTYVDLMYKRCSDSGVRCRKVELGDYLILKYFLAPLRKNKFSKKTSENTFLNGRKNKSSLKKMWVVVAIFDTLLFYTYIKLFSILGYIVICDRYFTDRIAGLHYYGYSNSYLNALYTSLMPHPDYLFLLTSDPKTSQKREQGDQHPLEFYEKLAKILDLVTNKIDAVRINTAEKSVEEVFSIISTSIQLPTHEKHHK